MISFLIKSQKQESQIANVPAKAGPQLLLTKSLTFNT